MRTYHDISLELRDELLAMTAEAERLRTLLIDWQEFATDVIASDCAGQEWLDMLKSRTEEVLKP